MGFDRFLAARQLLTAAGDCSGDNAGALSGESPLASVQALQAGFYWRADAPTCGDLSQADQ
jgi:hypothetical protein